MAVKTVIFSSRAGVALDKQTALVASEAAIASNLSHHNVVATYSHDIVDMARAVGPEPGVHKFYLIQVRTHACSFLWCPSHAHVLEHHLAILTPELRYPVVAMASAFRLQPQQGDHSRSHQRHQKPVRWLCGARFMSLVWGSAVYVCCCY